MAGRRNVVGETECCFFVIGANVEGGRPDVDRGIGDGPFLTIEDLCERSDECGDAFGAASSNDTGAAGSLKIPAIRSEQSQRFVGCWMKIRVEPGRERTTQRRVGLVHDRFGEVDEHGHVRRCQEIECGAQDSVLKIGVAGKTERPAERELAMQHARSATTFCLGSHEADRDRRETSMLEDVRQGTHGARAERSNRRQDDHVDAVVE